MKEMFNYMKHAKFKLISEESDLKFAEIRDDVSGSWAQKPVIDLIRKLCI